MEAARPPGSLATLRDDMTGRSPGRVTSSLLRAIPLVDLDELLRRGARDHVAESVQRQVVERLEAQTRLSHVHLLAGVGERVFECLPLQRIRVCAHEVQREVVLLRRERNIAEWLF